MNAKFGISVLITFALVMSPAERVAGAERAGELTGSPSGRYTLEQVFKGISSRDLKYRGAALRIEYSRTVNNAENQPPQKTDCTLLSFWNNSREEVRDAKGRLGFQHQAGGVRAEVGRRWQGFDLLLPYNDAIAEDQGERIFYHAHNHGFTSDGSVGLLVQGIEGWMTDHLRQADKAGNLTPTSNTVDGVPCVELAAGGFALCLAPQFDWSIVRCNDLTASGFRRFDGLWFPSRLTREKVLKDLANI